MIETEAGPELGLIIWEIDTSGGLTPDTARAAAAGMTKAAQAHPGAFIGFCFGDFNDDPREHPMPSRGSF